MSISVKHMLDRKGRDVVTVSRDATIEEVAKILEQKRIGAIVVTSLEDRIAGIFTERDLVRCVAKEAPAALSNPVSSAM
ncbi:CBS domain-containing protein, partial [Rhizobium rhizoryzae]|uniref:CBS domain-containing protein n=1 Tax=Rhizobium rhizoryzae TaxID=451876 RepID=UPI0028A726B9